MIRYISNYLSNEVVEIEEHGNQTVNTATKNRTHDEKYIKMRVKTDTENNRKNTNITAI